MLGRVDDAVVDTSAQRLYLINCLSALEQVLAGHPSCEAHAKRLSSAIESHVAALVRSHAGSMLAKSGLAEIVDRMR